MREKSLYTIEDLFLDDMEAFEYIAFSCQMGASNEMVASHGIALSVQTHVIRNRLKFLLSLET